jgi:hypothetical protein
MTEITTTHHPHPRAVDQNICLECQVLLNLGYVSYGCDFSHNYESELHYLDLQGVSQCSSVDPKRPWFVIILAQCCVEWVFEGSSCCQRKWKYVYLWELIQRLQWSNICSSLILYSRRDENLQYMNSMDWPFSILWSKDMVLTVWKMILKRWWECKMATSTKDYYET